MQYRHEDPYYSINTCIWKNRFSDCIFFKFLAMEHCITIRNITDIPCRVQSKVGNFDYSKSNEVELGEYKKQKTGIQTFF